MKTAALLSVIAFGAAAAAPARAPTLARGGGLTRAALLAIAESTAARFGDRHPRDIEAVRSTRGAAGGLIWPGAGVGVDRTPVYVITMRGRFTAYYAPVTGRIFPTGTVISLVVGASGRLRGRELDANLTYRAPPELERLGRVMRLSP